MNYHLSLSKATQVVSAGGIQYIMARIEDEY